ncbi:MAG: mechanosensitive ion channel family protein [Gammaproteobacteria bacterium]|nr:mechanosensitive ion channel family protein [Gammaproteobacteria bacterium]
MFTIYIIVCFLMLILSFFSIRYEKKISKKGVFKAHKLALYIFNRIIMTVSLLCIVQMISMFINVQESTLLEVDLLIFAGVISTSYFFKRLLIKHLYDISSSVLVINKLKYLSRFTILLIIFYAALDLLNVSATYLSIVLTIIGFSAFFIFFFYLQERLILHLDNKKIDKTVVMFTSRVFTILVLIIFAIIAMDIFNVSTTPILTFVGAASIAIGLSLQSSLSNLAAGILLIIFRPYKIGDIVKVDGINGVVQDINFLYTELRAFTGEVIFVPNSLSVSNKGVSNFSICRYRRIELSVGVDYDTDVTKLLQLGLETVNNMPGVLKNPATKVSIQDFADSAISIKFWIYARPKDYTQIKQDSRSILLDVFRKNNIDIPFNRLVVEMKEK